MPRELGRLFVPAKRATHTVHLVRYHRLTIARTAEDNAAIALAARDCFRRRANEERIIHRFFTERAEVLHLMPERAEQFFYLLLVTKAGVIGTERNFHFHQFVIPSEVEECLIVSGNGPRGKTITRDASTALDMTIVTPRAISPIRSRVRVRGQSTFSEC